MRLQIAVAVGTCCLALAQPKPNDKPKTHYSPFPELAQLKKTNPKQYEERFTRIVLEAQMSLAKFGYGTRFTGELDSVTRNALREYQTYTGLPANGELDEATWLAIEHDEKIAGDGTNRRTFPMFYFSYLDSFLSASGAWFENDTTEPTSATIECDKDRAYCVEGWSLYDGVATQLDTYNITRWDNVEIDAETNEVCGRSTLKISLQAKSVLHIGVSTGCFLPNETPRMEVMHLGDGWAWWSKQIEADAAAKRKVIRIPQPVRAKTSIFGDE